MLLRRFSWFVALYACAVGSVGAQGVVIEDLTSPDRPKDVAAQSSQDVRRGATSSSARGGGSLEDRVSRLERVLNNQALIDMLRRLEELQVETQTLRAEMDELAHSIDGLKSRQRDIYLDIDRRMQQVESRVSGASAATGTGPGAVGSASAAAGTTESLLAGQDARVAYEDAFKILRGGDYDQAIIAFDKYLEQYPDSDYSDNARYWLGEANYVTRRFKRAAEVFNSLLKRHPDSAKAPDATLKLGFTYYEMGEMDKARKTLETAKQRYPDSASARLADDRLRRMASEGR